MNTDTVKYLANLARIEVSENELAEMAKDLESIIGFVDEIQKVQIDADAIALSGQVNVFRDDAVAPLVPIYDLVDAAPAHQDHFVKVPKVLGE